MPTARSLLVVLVATAVACSRSKSAPPASREPPAAPLLDEPFADARALEAWQAVDGRVDGTPGSTSTISFDEGAVRLEGAADATRWRSLERTAPLAGAPWIRLAARIKTDGLVPDDVHRASCYVYARFSDAGGKHTGDLVATRSVLGTTPWTPVVRRFAVPAGATSVTVGLFLSLPGRAWFDDVRMEAAAAPDWHEATTGHYHYHWLGDDQIPDQKRAYNTESYRIAAEFLGLGAAASPAEVAYYKYPDKATKEELMGDPGNAYTLLDGSMHSIFPSDRHEIVHVLARAWGDPPALIAEGLAVHLSGSWQRQPVVAYAKAIPDHDWIALADLLDSTAFRARPDLTSYPIAGAFVAWTLAQPDGKAKLQQLYGKLSNRAPVAANRRAMEDILGATLEDSDAKLRAWLRTQ